MADGSVLLLFLYKVPQMEPIIFLIIALLQGMQEIIVKIARSGPLETGIKLILCGFFGRRHEKGIDLCRKGICVARIAFHQSLADCRF